MGAPRRRRARRSLVVVVIVGGLVAGCGRTAPDAAPPHRRATPTTASEQPPFAGTTWLLESSAGGDPNATPIPALLSAQPKLALDAAGRATGTDGCNDLGGTWTAEPLIITLNPTTGRSWSDLAITALALDVRSALARVAGHGIGAGILTLYSTSGTPLMTYSGSSDFSGVRRSRH